jgi:hypothetical protein
VVSCRSGSGEPVERRGAPPGRGVDSNESASFPLVLRRGRLSPPLRGELRSRSKLRTSGRWPHAEVIRRMELVDLMSELARLLSRRSSTPRRDALRIAHRRIRRYAGKRGLEESWCDAVLLQFLHEDHARGAA